MHDILALVLQSKHHEYVVLHVPGDKKVLLDVLVSVFSHSFPQDRVSEEVSRALSRTFR